MDVIILGGGVAGLTLGHRLAGSGRRVLLVEPSTRIGGVIGSEAIDGFLIERGPNSFSNTPEVVMDLIDEVGLRDRALCQPMAKHDRYIWKGGRLRKVPTSAGSFVTSDCLSLGAKLRLARGLFKSLPCPTGDLSLGEFFRPRLGDEAVDTLLKPFLAGIYASDADRVSFEGTFPKLHAPAREHGSLFAMAKSLKPKGPRKKRAPRSLVSFPNGLSELPAAASRAFEARGGEVLLGVPAQFRAGLNDRWQLTAGDRVVEAPELVLCGPAYQTAELLAEPASATAEVLRSIEYAPLTVVHVGIRAEHLSETRNGFGFLTVRGQGLRMLGMIWSDRIFPGRAPEGHRLLTCFYGGEIDPEATRLDDKELRSAVIDDLTKSMGLLKPDFRLFRVERWARALPIFRVGHMARIKQAVAALPPGLHLLANYLGGVSIPDRVAKSCEFADRLLKSSPQAEKAAT